ncbi:MAG: methyl-accepting chemotaxis protein [Desulfobulbaceae bacterium]|nr:methyl-accepting chemotaxis protein [Desulfobulbaceae bacterium]
MDLNRVPFTTKILIAFILAILLICATNLIIADRLITTETQTLFTEKLPTLFAGQIEGMGDTIRKTVRGQLDENQKEMKDNFSKRVNESAAAIAAAALNLMEGFDLEGVRHLLARRLEADHDLAQIVIYTNPGLSEKIEAGTPLAGDGFKAVFEKKSDFAFVKVELTAKTDTLREMKEKEAKSYQKLAEIIDQSKGAILTSLAQDSIALRRDILNRLLVGLALSLLMTGAIVGVALGIFLSLRFSRPINQIIHGLMAGGSHLSDAAHRVSDTSETLHLGVKGQVSSLKETTTALDKMAAMTTENSAATQQADTLMKKTAQVISTANSSMNNLTESMTEISRASEEISSIIKTIDGIAFQTNLLALNAAVEAARAGEAGAGFAVVADEVRNLALRSASSSKDTANLIESTVKKIKVGSTIVGETKQAFSEAAQDIARISGLMANIAEASTEQIRDMAQVSSALREVDKVTQLNDGTADDATTAAQELNNQAHEMRRVVTELRGMVGGNHSTALE